MKKQFITCVVALLITTMFSCTAFAADPFDDHRGGFGPELRGLQLGKALNISELVDTVCRIARTLASFRMTLSGRFGEDMGEIIFIVRESQITEFGIPEFGKNTEYQSAAHLGELFRDVDRRGFFQASISGMSGSWVFDVRASGNDQRKRIQEFELSVEAFGTRMSAEEFTADLTRRDSRMRFVRKDNYYEYRDEENGWAIEVGGGSFVRVYPIPMSVMY